MHEMSLAEGVLQIVEDAARRQGFARVRAIRLEIGAMAAVEPEALRFCFDVVSRETVADGARLEIVATEGQGQCLECGRRMRVRERYAPCPGCGGHRVQIIAGMEMRVRELEVDG